METQTNPDSKIRRHPQLRLVTGSDARRESEARELAEQSGDGPDESAGRNARRPRFGLFVLEKGNYYLIPFKDIIYMHSQKNRTIVYTEDRVYESTKYLRELVEKLPAHEFRRVHRQFAIRIEYIARMEYMAGGSYLVTLRDSENSQIPVGPSYAPGLIKFMGA